MYLDSWREDFAPGESVTLPVVVTNDTHDVQAGTVELLVTTAAGEVLARSGEGALEVAALGSETVERSVRVPDDEPYVIVAELRPDDASQRVVRSRRKIGFAHPGVAIADPVE